jgi:hypothetical protein
MDIVIFAFLIRISETSVLSYFFALKIVPPPVVPLGHVPFAVIFTSSEGKILLYEFDVGVTVHH